MGATFASAEVAAEVSAAEVWTAASWVKADVAEGVLGEGLAVANVPVVLAVVRAHEAVMNVSAWDSGRGAAGGDVVGRVVGCDAAVVGGAAAATRLKVAYIAQRLHYRIVAASIAMAFVVVDAVGTGQHGHIPWRRSRSGNPVQRTRHRMHTAGAVVVGAAVGAVVVAAAAAAGA